ncbi:Cytochrome P450 2C39 [Halotydeus destructor]|nr:Cytochrome P450 2C39 [Halotydeus destructor]
MFFVPVILFILSICYILKRSKVKGPTGLPLLGYVPFLTKHPYKKFLELSKSHGPVYAITIWGRSYYILNSFQSVKEALTGGAINDRPSAFSYLNENLQRSAIGAFNGTKWRTQRKFIMTAMMGQSSMTQNSDVFISVAQDLVDFMRSTNGQPTDFRDILSKSTTNAITSVLYSKKYDWDDEELIAIRNHVCCMLHTLQGLEFSYAGPYFEFMMKTVHRQRHWRVVEAANACSAIFQRIARERLGQLELAKKNDFFDQFLSNHVQEIKDNVPEHDRIFTMKVLGCTSFGLIQGAADTTSETLYWALYFMAKHLDVQRKLQKELDGLIGTQVLTLADRGRLPYLVAVLDEVQRAACMLPTGTTREATVDSVVCGVSITKGSYVIPNIYACLTDEENFPQPHIFDPSRHINGDGKFAHSEANCQLTLGKRNCVGETFARYEMFILLGTIIQNFDVKFPSEDYQVGITDGAYQVLYPHQLCISVRHV